MKASGFHVHMYEDTHMNMYIVHVRAHTPPHIAMFPKAECWELRTYISTIPESEGQGNHPVCNPR